MVSVSLLQQLYIARKLGTPLQGMVRVINEKVWISKTNPESREVDMDTTLALWRSTLFIFWILAWSHIFLILNQVCPFVDIKTCKLRHLSNGNSNQQMCTLKTLLRFAQKANREIFSAKGTKVLTFSLDFPLSTFIEIFCSMWWHNQNKSAHPSVYPFVRPSVRPSVHRVQMLK